MSRNNRHIKKPEDPVGSNENFFTGVHIPWEKSKDEVWKDLSHRLQEGSRKKVEIRRFLPGRPVLAAAASLALLLAVTLFMRLYVRETRCPAGTHASVVLPDGSRVELNARTTIRFHPYWWFLSREIHLEGEAYFDVKKGKHFRVVSSLASTQVLGTTFTVYARDMNYRVTCMSGLVQVTSALTDEKVTLAPNELADLNQSGVFDITTLNKEVPEPGWMNNLIMFSSTPLRLVFDEIERQYDIIIETPEGMNQLYSGNFSLNEPVNKVLYLLCRPFDLQYEQYTGKKYIVYPARTD